LAGSGYEAIRKALATRVAVCIDPELPTPWR
jgi:hypothetical protein